MNPIKNREESIKTIVLPAEKVIKTIPAYEVKVKEILIRRIEDDSANKTVKAITKGVTGDVLLWSGESYDAIGQWTDADVQARILELFTQ